MLPMLPSAPPPAFLGRGAMVAATASPADIAALGDLGATLARWQLTWNGFPRGEGDGKPVAEYRVWLDGALGTFDAALPAFKAKRMRAVLDLHTPPGGRTDWYDLALFGNTRGNERELQEEFVATWARLARRYKGNATIAAFDLVNEPSGAKPEVWGALALRAIDAIRAEDPSRTIVFEAVPWGGAEGLGDLKPLPRPNVVYSFHTYDPMEVTHQGVFGRAKGVRYPGPVQVEVRKDGKVVGTRTEVWDRARLSRAIEPARLFARRTGMPVYVGEFGCVRWAPDGSAARWIADAASLFEREGWAWTIHAWREWDGWSPEHGEDEAVKEPIPGGTERLKLLKKLLKAKS